LCGILGIWAKNTAGKAQIPRLPFALKTLLHRGPDHNGSKLFASVGLAHARLSIIDISAQANQPFSDASGRYCLVYNGEIFNYRELRTELEQKGTTFRSNSDTEVLLHLLIESGISGLTKLNGFFAFAFYDREENKMLIARDRFGVKPLLYYEDDDKLIVSSEMPAFFKFDIDKTPDLRAINHYFSLTYVPSPESVLMKVRSLDPGSYLEISTDAVAVKHYFTNELLSAETSQNYDRSQSELFDLLSKSVERRLVADVPVGCFLSGGLDSSIVAALARQQKTDIETFSIGFDHPWFDESAYAEEVAKFINTRHHAFKLTSRDFVHSLPRFLDSVTEPFGDSSAFASFMLAEKTRTSLKVCLSGDGADEVFAGYRKHKAELALRNLGSVTSGALKIASVFLSGSEQNRDTTFGDFGRKLQKFRQGMREPDQVRYWNWCCFISDSDRTALLKSPIYQGLNVFGDFPVADMNDVLLFDQKLVLPNDMLKKVDMTSMAHALEVRTPFLDHHVVRFANALPWEYKIDSKSTKKILRDTFGHLLPKSVVGRKKAGFEIPLKVWMEEEMVQQFSRGHWRSDYLSQQGIFNVSFVDSILTNRKAFFTGDRIYLVWAMIVFQHWWVKYVQPLPE